MEATVGATRRRAGLPFDLDRDWDHLAWPVFGVILLVAFIYLNFKGRGANFFYDEWGWIQGRYTGLHGILASYNNHLLAAPIALYQLLFRTVGLAHYWVYRLLHVCVHLGCAAVVFECARRRLGMIAVLVALPIVFLGSAWEYVLEPVNIGFVASIGLSIGALLLLERDDPLRNGVACALLVFGVACSEFTTVFVLGIAVELLWRDRSPRRGWVWLVPLLVYAAWWLGYHESTSFRQNFTSAPSYAADLAANATGGLFGLTIDWGRPLLVAAIVLLIVHVRRPRAMTPRLGGLLVAACAFWALVALGRAGLGEPTAARYIYPGATLLVLIAAEALRGTRLKAPEFGVAALVALFAVTANIKILTDGQAGLVLAARTVSAELAAVELSHGNLPPQLIVDTHYAPTLFVGKYLAATHALQSSPADSRNALLRQSEDARVAADTLLIRGGELSSQPATSLIPTGSTPPTVDLAASGTATTAGGCVTFRSAGSGAAFDLTLPASGLLVKAAPGPPVAIRAHRFASGYDGAPVATLPGAHALRIAASADRSPIPWHLRISPDQAIVACSAG